MSLTHVRYYRLAEGVEPTHVRDRLPNDRKIQLLEPADDHARAAWSCALHVHGSAEELDALWLSKRWRAFDAWLTERTVVVKHWNLQEPAS